MHEMVSILNAIKSVLPSPRFRKNRNVFFSSDEETRGKGKKDHGKSDSSSLTVDVEEKRHSGSSFVSTDGEEQEQVLHESAEQVLSSLDKFRDTHKPVLDVTDRILVSKTTVLNKSVFIRDIPMKTTGHGQVDIQLALERASNLAHQNINRINFAKSHRGRMFVVSDLAKGNVADKITRSNSISFSETLTLDDALDIALAVSSAAAYLHASGLYNLYLKPSSILCFPDKEYKLSESCLGPVFSGASRGRVVTLLSNGDVRFVKKTSLKREDSYLCTVPQMKGHIPTHEAEYSSIEVLSGAESVCPKSDVFSFGMLLWQLLHLKSPYPKDWGPMLILNSLKQGHRPYIDPGVIDMVHPLRRIIETCWSTNVRARPTFQQVHESLLQIRAAGMAGMKEDVDSPINKMQFLRPFTFDDTFKSGSYVEECMSPSPQPKHRPALSLF